MTEAERSYYLEAADFDGYVSKARQELKGLTAEHYQNWFISRSLAYYRVCEATARSSKGLFMQLFAQNPNGWKLLQRRQGRLYIRRNVDRVKEGLSLALWAEERGLKNIYEGGKSVAADPVYFIATELKRIATGLCSEADILRKARLSPTACKGSYELNPDFGDDNELFTGERIAAIQYFQILLSAFEDATAIINGSGELHLLTGAPPVPVAVSPRSKATIAELCRLPFTPADLGNLLRHLQLIDAGEKCLTNHLAGKAQGPRSKFTAAYRVLQRRQLMDETSNDAEWAKAFHLAYGAVIGKTARGYQLNSRGQAESKSSDPFRKGVDDVTDWVDAWQNHQSRNV